MNYVQATAKRGNLRFPLLGSDPARGGATVRFPRPTFIKSIACVLCLIIVSGCATLSSEQALPPTQAIPSLHGSYHRVRPGETLWRIARSYGLSVEALASINRLPSARRLAVGQRLFIPLPPESAKFLWPVRGSTTAMSKAIAIRAPDGSLVRASRSGRVAVAAQRVSGVGKTVILDHLDGYFTIYGGLKQIVVSPGSHVRQGIPIGSVGSSSLHFEIRYGPEPASALALLPNG